MQKRQDCLGAEIFARIKMKFIFIWKSLRAEKIETNGLKKLKKDPNIGNKYLPCFAMVLAILVSTTFYPMSSQAEEIMATGTFSSMYYHEEGGDLLGYELRIVQGKDGFEGTWQSACGVPNSLVLVKPKIEGKTITFSYSYDGKKFHHFRGKYTDYGIEREGMADSYWEKLKRRPSYWEVYANTPEGSFLLRDL